MVKFFSQVVSLMAVLASSTGAQQGVPPISILSQTFGGPHGNLFTDSGIISSAQNVHSVTIRTGERVNGVGIDLTDRWGIRNTVYHGGNGGNPQTLSLNSGERVECLEAHWGKHNGRTRVKYIKITTTSSRSIAGGTPTTSTGKVCAPNGYQLGGFIGYSGAELDQVGAIWTINQDVP